MAGAQLAGSSAGLIDCFIWLQSNGIWEWDYPESSSFFWDIGEGGLKTVISLLSLRDNSGLLYMTAGFQQ